MSSFGVSLINNNRSAEYHLNIFDFQIHFYHARLKQHRMIYMLSIIPGAKASKEKHSPVEAIDVTRDRRLLKYCERMVTVGRKARQ